MKKLLILLITSIVVLTGCGREEVINYEDPQVYFDAVHEAITSDNDTLGAAKEYFELIGVEESANLYIESAKNLITVMIDVYPESKKDYYNRFIGTLETFDFVEIEETFRNNITSYNEASETQQEAETSTVNELFNLITEILDDIAEFYLSDDFQTYLDTGSTIYEIIDGIENTYGDINDFGVNLLLREFGV